MLVIGELTIEKSAIVAARGAPGALSAGDGAGIVWPGNGHRDTA